MTMSDVTLQSLLRYSHFRRGGCRIVWDLRYQPQNSVRHYRSPNHVIPHNRLTEFATRPPVPAMTIKCNIFPHPWPIYVANAHGVRVIDVLQAIQQSMRTPITSYEWHGLSPKQKQGVSAAFAERWSRTPDAYYEYSRGVRRVDCLQRHTRFAGLSKSWNAPYTWDMTLARQR